MIYLNSFGGPRFSFAYDVAMRGVYVEDAKGKTDIPLKQGMMAAFEAWLSSLGCSYQQVSKDRTPTYDLNRQQVHLGTVLYAVAKDSRSLHKLVNARTDHEIGIALGYPRDAVATYNKVIDGVKRDGMYFNRSIGNVIKQGVKVPIWIPYISHVPRNFDLVSGNISTSSERQGKLY